MNVSEFIERIDRAKTPEELREIADAIYESKKKDERDKKGLSEGDIRVLMSIHLLPKLYKLVGEGKELYLKEAEEALAKIEPYLTEEAYELVRMYLLVIAPTPGVRYGYRSLETLRKRVVKYIPGLIEFYHKKLRRPIDVLDFDRKRLLDGYLVEYITSRYPKSEHSQYNMATIINKFGKWLEKRRDIRFPRAEFERPEGERFPEYYLRERAKMGERVGIKIGKGVVRKPAEIDRIFAAIDQLAKWREPFRAEQLRLFYRFLFQRGLRPEHARALRMQDIEESSLWFRDALGRKHLVISYREVFARERRRLGFSMSKIKMVPKLIQISESLYRSIIKLADDYGLRDDDLVFSIPTSSTETAMKRIKEITGLKDFTRYDARATWTSAVWNILVYGEVIIPEYSKGTAYKTLLDLGGWRTANIPVDHYIGTLTASEALEIVTKCEIYLPSGVTPVVEAIKKGIVQPEIEYMKKELKFLREVLPPDIRKKLEEVMKREYG